MIRDPKFYKTLCRLSLPAALQSLISFLVVVADDVMVSKLPNAVIAQAGVAQVNSITAFFTTTLAGLVGGSTVLISQYWGKRDTAHIRRVFSIVLWVCLSFTALIVLLARVIPMPILSIVIKREETEVLALASKYFAIVCWSYIPYAISTALIGMLRAVEVVRIMLITTIMALFINISLNYCLIFGHFGCPALGVEGAAIATLIARIIELIVVWIYTYRIQKNIELHVGDLRHLDLTLAGDYVKYGLPVGVMDMQWAAIGMMKSAIIGHQGAAFIAAVAITNNMEVLGRVFTSSLSGGACIVIGKSVGRGDYAETRRYSNTIQILFACCGVLISALVFAVRVPFVRLYGSSADPAVFKLATTTIAILAVTLLGTSYHAACFTGINRGAGDSRFCAVVDSICGWLVVMPLTLCSAYVFHWPLPVLYLCTRIDQCFKWIVALIRLRGNKWIRNVTRDN